MFNSQQQKNSSNNNNHYGYSDTKPDLPSLSNNTNNNSTTSIYKKPNNIPGQQTSDSTANLNDKNNPKPSIESNSNSNSEDNNASNQNSSRFGLLGLLQVIRMTESDLNTLALGNDLTTLGLNLNSAE